MSTIIFKLETKKHINYNTYYGVKSFQSLGDYVREVMNEKGLSGHEVSRRSGGHITHAYVTAIKNGQKTNPSTDKLKALAKGLGVDEAEIMGVALGRTSDDPSIEEALFHAMGYNYSRLSKKDKEVLRPFLETVMQQIKQRLPKSDLRK